MPEGLPASAPQSAPPESGADGPALWRAAGLTAKLTTAAIAGLLALTGCTGGAGALSASTSESASPSSTSGSSTPIPTPTLQYKPADANGPAQNVPLPVKPPLADDFSKEGLEAFARYWYETLSYAYESGDTKPMDAISARECPTCTKTKAVINGWHQDGRWLVGGRITVHGAQSKFVRTPSNDYQVIASVSQGPLDYYNGDGSLNEATPADPPITDIVIATYSNGIWTASTVEHLGGSLK